MSVRAERTIFTYFKIKPDGIDHSAGAIFGVGPKNPRTEFDTVTNEEVTRLMRAFPRVLCHTKSQETAVWRRVLGERQWTIGSRAMREGDVKRLANDFEALRERRFSNPAGEVVDLDARRAARSVTP